MPAEATARQDAGAPVAQAPADRPPASLAGALARCRALADTIGAKDFSLFFLAAQGETRRLAPVFDSASPRILQMTKALSSRDSETLARKVADSAAPLWWRAPGAPPFLNASARCWAEETQAPAGAMPGIALPVSIARGRSGAVVFHGGDMAIDEDRLCDLHARCFALFADVALQRIQDCSRDQPVSKRELECLRLTANGSTSEEIAGSLGLSVHTANQYLTNSTHKLNAVNRIHAVAKALRSGLID